MLKKHMAACLVATAFMTLPALAQTSTAPSSSPPAVSQPTTGASSRQSTMPSSAASGQFMSQQETDQWRSSKLVGLNVYGTDNEKIGDINEILVDRQGNLDAIVIGVGGFLGIGEKNVAIPFKSVEFVDTPRTSTRTSDASTRSTDTSARSSDMSARTDATGSTAPTTDRPATTATTGTTAGPSASTSAATDRTAGSSANRSADRGYPDHAMVRMSRADLQNAPTFHYAGDRRSDDSRRSDSGSSSAPRQ